MLYSQKDHRKVVDFIGEFQQTCQFHQVETNLIKLGLLQQLIETTNNLQQACG